MFPSVVVDVDVTVVGVFFVFFYMYVCIGVSLCEGLFTSQLTSEKDQWDLGRALPLIEE